MENIKIYLQNGFKMYLYIFKIKFVGRNSSNLNNVIRLFYITINKHYISYFTKNIIMLR